MRLPLGCVMAEVIGSVFATAFPLVNRKMRFLIFHFLFSKCLKFFLPSLLKPVKNAMFLGLLSTWHRSQQPATEQGSLVCSYVLLGASWMEKDYPSGLSPRPEVLI